MRVLLTTDPIGGVWIFTRELARELLDRGHHVALVSFGRSPSRDQRRACEDLAAAHGEAFQFHSSEAPLEWMQANERVQSEAAPFLERVAHGFAPEILHANQFCFGSLPFAIPKLLTAHSDVLSWAEACRPSSLQPSAWLDRYIALVQAGLASAHCVSAPTAWMLAALKRNFATPPHAQVIANGRTLRLPRQPAARKLRAVCAGRLWDDAKNLALLTRIPSPIPFLVAGECAQDADSAPQPGNSLYLLGQQDEQEIVDLFSQSSIYLVPSLYEPFGLAPLEAALCGCAVLANNIPSLREVWGNAALYFHDECTLVLLLKALAANPEMLAAAQQASARRAATFTASRMAEAYLDLYEDLIKPTPAPSLYQLAAHAS